MSDLKMDFPVIFREVTCGNEPAYAFCVSYFAWVHLIDDAIDQDKPIDTEVLLVLSLEAAAAFAFNPFWQSNKDALLPLVIQGACAYADSNEWARRESKRDRQTSDVLKSEYQSVIWHVAFLCGGYDHARSVMRKHRAYNYDVAD